MRLTERQLDILTELFNMGVGRGAAVLNTMLQSHIRLSVPCVKMMTRKSIAKDMETIRDKRLATVGLKFNGNFTGKIRLIFTQKTAAALVASLVADPAPEMDVDAVKAGTLMEVGNIVLNSVMGSMANLLGIRFNYSVPDYLELEAKNLIQEFDQGANGTIVGAKTRFLVEKLEMNGDIVLFLEVTAFDRLLKAIEALNDKIRDM